MTSDKAPHEPTLFDLPLHEEPTLEANQPELDPPATGSPVEPESSPTGTLEYAPLLAFQEKESKPTTPSTPASQTTLKSRELGPADSGLPVSGPSRSELATSAPALAAAPAVAVNEPQQADYEALATPARPKNSQLTRRALAAAADLAIAVAVSLALVPLTSLLAVRLSAADWPGFAAFVLPFSFLWQVLPLGFRGRTPGMSWNGLRVEDGAGNYPTFGQSARRWLGLMLSVLSCGLLALLALTGRSLSDRLSASRIVDE